MITATQSMEERSAELENLTPEEAVAALLDAASDMNASDLFLESNVDNVSIAVRHLGIIHPFANLSNAHGRRFISHIKAVAEMDVAERRRPLDGRWLVFTRGGDKLDLRINTIPTLHGEDLAIRILECDHALLTIDQLGLIRAQRTAIVQLLNRPSGLVLVTGPTGSGKTTTLYSCLQTLNDGKRKISTIEDPIEFEVDGFRQSQVNQKLQLDFPELLRSVLRQAPDIIMIGEIRDRITAETAVRAANSGHQVFATLHAPVAASAVQVMLSLGVNTHFLASALVGVVAQRLVRVLCPDCRVAVDVSDSPYTFDDIRPWMEEPDNHHLYAPGGCEKCYGTGYIARTAVFEVLTVQGKVKRQIAEQAEARQIEATAVDQGMIEFRRAALLAVANGTTSTEEILRTVPFDYLEDE
ncbi:MAG: type II/IV secretion system protein [Phycisphaeraceae bacterium]|nr:type II/IV secretion system protein [Phycisphaeraceae bacterium]